MLFRNALGRWVMVVLLVGGCSAEPLSDEEEDDADADRAMDEGGAGGGNDDNDDASAAENQGGRDAATLPVGGGGAGQGGSATGGAAGGAGGAMAPGLQKPVKIQPLGDSITQGKRAANEASYRRPLWKKLMAAGYEVDFVGSTNMQLDGPPFFQDYDHDHEGHYGWRITDVLPKLDGWLKGYAPDVSLIHLGTNDQGSNNSSQMLANMALIIDKLRSKNPRIIIIVAKLIEPSPTGRAFGDMLPMLAAQKGTTQSPIIVVDQDQGFTPADTIDGIHPNPMGQEKMASKWFDALIGVLPNPTLLPPAP